MINLILKSPSLLKHILNNKQRIRILNLVSDNRLFCNCDTDEQNEMTIKEFNQRNQNKIPM